MRLMEIIPTSNQTTITISISQRILVLIVITEDLLNLRQIIRIGH